MSYARSEHELVVESVRVHMKTGRHVLLLKEVEGGRILPVWIGQWEAQAIAMRLQGIGSERPLTHDLFVTSLRAMGVELDRVVISSLASETFHARLVLRGPDGVREVDARPSDAVALAVRVDCPIFAAPAVLDQAASLPDLDHPGAGEDGDEDDDADPNLDEAVAAAADAGVQAPARESLEKTGERLDPLKLAVFRDFINSLDSDQGQRGS